MNLTANLDVLEKDEIVEHARHLGTTLRDTLAQAAGTIPIFLLLVRFAAWVCCRQLNLLQTLIIIFASIPNTRLAQKYPLRA